MKKPISFAFDGVPYDSPCFIMFNYNEKTSRIKIEKYLQMVLPNTSFDVRGKFIYNYKNNKKLIWIQNDSDIVSISHEVIHYVIRTFLEVGILIGGDSDEAFTYLHDYLFETN